MEYSEIIVVLLVYSGLIAFFLVPFQNRKSLINQLSGPISFKESYKKSLLNILFHKKAILALILLFFVLINIWLGYAATEYHINAHSGYPPISTDLKAIYSMMGVFMYTVILTLLIAFMSTVKLLKDA